MQAKPNPSIKKALETCDCSKFNNLITHFFETKSVLTAMKNRILFVCIHNSARSQIAEELMRQICDSTMEVESAGLSPGELNPLAIEVLLEEGIDIREKATKDVFEVYKSGKLFSHVITVCDEASAEKCPIFPGVVKKLHWSFADPSQFTGTHDEKLEKTRAIKDQIKKRIYDFCDQYCEIASIAG